MVSRTAQSTLAEMLMAIGTSERELESLRQTICAIEDFNMKNAFERLDRAATGYLTARELLDFLVENNVTKASMEAVQKVFEFYDCNEDGNWSLREFNQMILPCERAELARKAVKRVYKGKLQSDQKLPQVQELTLLCIIEREVSMQQKIAQRSREFNCEGLDIQDKAVFKTILAASTQKSSSSYVDLNRFEAFLRLNGFEPAQTELLGIIRRMDRTGDMRITYGEWRDFFGSSKQAADQGRVPANESSTGKKAQALRKKSTPLRNQSNVSAHHSSVSQQPVVSTFSPGPPVPPKTRNKQGSFQSAQIGAESQRNKRSKQPQQVVQTQMIVANTGRGNYRTQAGNADMHFVSSFGRKSSRSRDGGLVNRSANISGHYRNSSAIQFYQQSHQSAQTGATPSFPVAPNSFQEVNRSRSPNENLRSPSPYGDGRILQSVSTTQFGQLSPGQHIVINPGSAIHFQSHADSHLMHSFEADHLINNSRLLSSGLDRSFANSPIVQTDVPRHVYAVHDGSTGNPPIRPAMQPAGKIGSGINNKPAKKSQNQSRNSVSSSQRVDARAKRSTLHQVPEKHQGDPTGMNMPAQSQRVMHAAIQPRTSSNEQLILSQRQALISQRSDCVGLKKYEPDLEYQLQMAGRMNIPSSQNMHSPLRTSYHRSDNNEGQTQPSEPTQEDLVHSDNQNATDDGQTSFAIHPKEKSKKLRQLEERIKELTLEQSKAEAQRNYLEVVDQDSSILIYEEDKIQDNQVDTSAEKFVGRVRESSARLRQIEQKLKELRSSKVQKPKMKNRMSAAGQPRDRVVRKESMEGSQSKIERFRKRADKLHEVDRASDLPLRSEDMTNNKPLRQNFVAPQFYNAINEASSNNDAVDGVFTHRAQPRDGGRSSRTEPMGKPQQILEHQREQSKHGSQDYDHRQGPLKDSITQQGQDDEILVEAEDNQPAPMLLHNPMPHGSDDKKTMPDQLPSSRVQLLEQVQRIESQELVPVMDSQAILQIDEVKEIDEEEDMVLKEQLRLRQKQEEVEEQRQRQLQIERELQRQREQEQLDQLERQYKETRRKHELREQEREFERQRLLKQRQIEIQRKLDEAMKRDQEREMEFQNQKVKIEQQHTTIEVDEKKSIPAVLKYSEEPLQMEQEEVNSFISSPSKRSRSKSQYSSGKQSPVQKIDKQATFNGPLEIQPIKKIESHEPSPRSQFNNMHVIKNGIAKEETLVRQQSDEQVIHSKPIASLQSYQYVNSQQVSPADSQQFQIRKQSFDEFGGLQQNTDRIRQVPMQGGLGSGRPPASNQSIGGFSNQRSFDGKHIDHERESMVRPAAQFSGWISSAANAKFPAEAGRYHLYINLGCPWSCSCITILYLKGLEQKITVSNTKAELQRMEDGRMGWAFDESEKSSVVKGLESHDFIYHFSNMQQVYKRCDPNFKGPYTVPCLVDKATHTIVSNDSGDICKMLSKDFDKIAPRKTLDFYPDNLQLQIDRLDDTLKKNIMEGVYLAGFAKTQDQYDRAVNGVFDELNNLEKKLFANDFLVAERLTYVDIRLFQFLIRFDPVFFLHFKCNKQTLRSYRSINKYVKALFHQEKLGEFVDMDHIKRHYYRSHPAINPSGLIPIGPDNWWLEKEKKTKERHRDR